MTASGAGLGLTRDTWQKCVVKRTCPVQNASVAGRLQDDGENLAEIGYVRFPQLGEDVVVRDTGCTQVGVHEVGPDHQQSRLVVDYCTEASVAPEPRDQPLRRQRVMNASAPAHNEVDVAATVATVEPSATVTTKSKLDIFDSERRPTIRITVIAATRIAIVETTTNHISSTDVPSQFDTTVLSYGCD